MWSSFRGWDRLEGVHPRFQLAAVLPPSPSKDGCRHWCHTSRRALAAPRWMLCADGGFQRLSGQKERKKAVGSRGAVATRRSASARARARYIFLSFFLPVRPPLGRQPSSGHAPAVRTSRYCLYLGCGGAGPVAGGPRGGVCNDIAPRFVVYNKPGREGVNNSRAGTSASWHRTPYRLQYRTQVPRENVKLSVLCRGANPPPAAPAAG